MATTTSNPGAPEPQPTPQPQPTPPTPRPGQPRPGEPREDEEERRRAARNEPRQLLTVTGQAWEPPPPATPTQEELDAIALGEYDPTAPPEAPITTRRSMEGQQGGGYVTR